MQTLQPNAAFNAIVAMTAGLPRGSMVSLLDLDDTVYRPDVYGLLVDRYASDPDVWRAADKEFNRPGSPMTARELFQLALDEIHRHPEFSLAHALAVVHRVHRLIYGADRFVRLLHKYKAHPFAMSNGLREFARPLLGHHNLRMPVLANYIERSSSGSPLFIGIHGESGLDKRQAAMAFKRLGFRVIVGAGDSKSDIGLAQVAIESGGFALARAGRGLERWCKDNAPAGSWLGYDVFDSATLKWIEEKLRTVA